VEVVQEPGLIGVSFWKYCQELGETPRLGNIAKMRAGQILFFAITLLVVIVNGLMGIVRFFYDGQD
jgi:hypothetical protein